MRQIILITGGARSGKSSYAEKLALSLSPNPVYMATSRIWDEEFRQRVLRHQANRGPEWTNIEEEKELSRHQLEGRVILIDCVTLWCTNFFFDLDADIDKAVKEAAEFEAQDKKRKEAIDTRNDADAFVFQTQQALDQVGNNLDAADKSAVEADLNALKALVDANPQAENMTDDQVAEMKAAKEKLMESAQKVFAKMYENAQAAQGAAGAGPDMGAGAAGGAAAGSADDDVVDADYKEV